MCFIIHLGIRYKWCAILSWRNRGWLTGWWWGSNGAPVSKVTRWDWRSDRRFLNHWAGRCRLSNDKIHVLSTCAALIENFSINYYTAVSRSQNISWGREQQSQDGKWHEVVTFLMVRSRRSSSVSSEWSCGSVMWTEDVDKYRKQSAPTSEDEVRDEGQLWLKICKILKYDDEVTLSCHWRPLQLHRHNIVITISAMSPFCWKA